MTNSASHRSPAPAGVATRRVAGVALGVLLFLAASIGGTGLMYFTAVPHGQLQTPADLPEPRLQTHAAQDLQALLERQRHALRAYSIERANSQIVLRGEHAYEPIASDLNQAKP